ncbi:hypothetical protein [Corynebacterium testudinoris]|uniref:Uncharacterized protein n=1 Tax=Corynebacterium testudinoris TaxID=136857 RepID=A0A0G3H8J1_9CORY|nr:hypothetical protein [Corynebacterium testudinoris]AKK07487.1 hypothetical protein CTEST_00080 [Corynebacterium testudinoris]
MSAVTDVVGALRDRSVGAEKYVIRTDLEFAARVADELGEDHGP